jgi:hypothetical protein
MYKYAPLKNFFPAFAFAFALVASAQVCQAQWTTNQSGDGINNNSSGKIGIGASPSANLEVNIGTTYTADKGLRVSGSYPNIQLYSNYNTSDARNWAIINPWTAWGLLEFRVSNAQNGDPINNGTSVLTLNRTGNVGIGTAIPVRRLEVSGTGVSEPVLRLNRSANTDNGLLMLSTGGNEDWLLGNRSVGDNNFRLYSFGTNSDVLTVLRSSGNVGIGTTSPNYKLQVAGNTAVGVQSALDAFQYFFNGSNSSYTSLQQTSSEFRVEQTYSSTGGYLPISFRTAGAERLKIDTSGNTNVTGDLHVTGNIAAKYQDVAEWVPSSEQLSAGTVVVLDATKSNQVTSSSVSYDTRVAGVVSAQPGIALGEKSEGKVLVATTGRVRVKVDATKGPIHIGDLLVTSDIPGVAMKSEPVNLGGVQIHRPGTLIGKALEPLEKGTGSILVLLSLQ